MQGSKENTNNPLASFLILIVFMVLAVVPYLLTAAAYGTFNSERWQAESASISIMMLFVIGASGMIIYFFREINTDVEGWVRRHVNIDELADKPYLDYLLAHYGYVASAATFCAAIIYVAKWLLPRLGVTAVSLFTSITVFFVFIVYGLVFAKAVWGARLRSALAIFLLLPMVLLDVTLMQMAIQGANGLYEQNNEVKECASKLS